jgi:hypothetical protein
MMTCFEIEGGVVFSAGWLLPAPTLINPRSMVFRRISSVFAHCLRGTNRLAYMEIQIKQCGSMTL